MQFNYSLDRRLFVTNKTENRVRHYTVDHSKPKSDPNLSSLLLVVWRNGIHSWSRTPQTHLSVPFGLLVALPFPPDEREGREGEGKPRIRLTLAESTASLRQGPASPTSRLFTVPKRIVFFCLVRLCSGLRYEGFNWNITNSHLRQILELSHYRERKGSPFYKVHFKVRKLNEVKGEQYLSNVTSPLKLPLPSGEVDTFPRKLSVTNPHLRCGG